MVKDIDESKAPLLEHLIELRTRLIRSIVAILVLFMVGFYFAQDVYNFLVEPLFQIYQSLGHTDRMMVYTALHEAFFTQVKVALFSALFVSFPFVAAQIWMFVAPGLYKHEKGAFLPFLVLTPILFFAGGAFVYYVM
ncbi:MAG: twin-arginine translocase subunit TatC, partial [Proteobacteria bacterium]|nr:twin-arginine translocase subunit TatC [Pseudomonadota bacterium]